MKKKIKKILFGLGVASLGSWDTYGRGEEFPVAIEYALGQTIVTIHCCIAPSLWVTRLLYILVYCSCPCATTNRTCRSNSGGVAAWLPATRYVLGGTGPARSKLCARLLAPLGPGRSPRRAHYPIDTTCRQRSGACGLWTGSPLVLTCPNCEHQCVTVQVGSVVVVWDVERVRNAISVVPISCTLQLGLVISPRFSLLMRWSLVYFDIT